MKESKKSTQTNPNWEKEWNSLELPDFQDTVDQVKSWDKHAGHRNIPFLTVATILAVMAVIVGIVVAIVTSNVDHFLQANDIFIPCK